MMRATSRCQRLQPLATGAFALGALIIAASAAYAAATAFAVAAVAAVAAAVLAAACTGRFACGGESGLGSEASCSLAAGHSYRPAPTSFVPAVPAHIDSSIPC